MSAAATPSGRIRLSRELVARLSKALDSDRSHNTLLLPASSSSSSSSLRRQQRPPSGEKKRQEREQERIWRLDSGDVDNDDDDDDDESSSSSAQTDRQHQLCSSSSSSSSSYFSSQAQSTHFHSSKATLLDAAIDTKQQRRQTHKRFSPLLNNQVDEVCKVIEITTSAKKLPIGQRKQQQQQCEFKYKVVTCNSKLLTEFKQQQQQSGFGKDGKGSEGKSENTKQPLESTLQLNSHSKTHLAAPATSACASLKRQEKSAWPLTWKRRLPAAAYLPHSNCCLEEAEDEELDAEFSNNVGHIATASPSPFTSRQSNVRFAKRRHLNERNKHRLRDTHSASIDESSSGSSSSRSSIESCQEDTCNLRRCSSDSAYKSSSIVEREEDSLKKQNPSVILGSLQIAQTVCGSFGEAVRTTATTTTSGKRSQLRSSYLKRAKSRTRSQVLLEQNHASASSRKCENEVPASAGRRTRKPHGGGTHLGVQCFPCDTLKQHPSSPAAGQQHYTHWLPLFMLAFALLLPAALAQLPALAGEQQKLNSLLLMDNEGASSSSSRLPLATSVNGSIGSITGLQVAGRGDSQLIKLREEEEAATTAAAPDGEKNSKEGAILEGLLDFGRIFLMSSIIVGDICGNSLVILSVCRHSKLRVTTNWFVVSLACADILVALFAMTFNASYIISGRWLFKPWVCDFWNACDVLASTASILHLCCISIDRYIAITRPLDYPMKITTRRVIYALCAVWISSALLSYIPIFTGIYTTAEHIQWLKENPEQCEFTVNRVYAIVSSSISFWIPCCIMVFTYYRIYREATRQEKFIYKAQTMLPAAHLNQHHSSSNHHHHHHHSGNSSTSGKHTQQSRQKRSKSVALTASNQPNTQSRQQVARNQHKPDGSLVKSPASGKQQESSTTIQAISSPSPGTQQNDSGDQLQQQRASSLLQLADGNQNKATTQQQQEQVGKLSEPTVELASEEQDSNSGQSTPTKRSISKMKREHKAAKTLGIIMGVFILCWLPFFSWYTQQHICGHACDGMVPKSAVTLLFWIGYFNSTLNPIIYAYFNHEFRDAFKKTLQWIFCCCNDLKCLRVNRPNDNHHYNCTYRSTQEIGLVNNS